MKQFLVTLEDEADAWEVDDKRSGGSHGNEMM